MMLQTYQDSIDAIRAAAARHTMITPESIAGLSEPSRSLSYTSDINSGKAAELRSCANLLMEELRRRGRFTTGDNGSNADRVVQAVIESAATGEDMIRDLAPLADRWV